MIMKISKIVILMITMTFLIVGCGNQNKTMALVNDEPILESDFEIAMNQIKTSYLDQGIDLNSSDISQEDIAMIEHQVLNRLIDQKLINQEMQKQDISISREEIEAELSKLRLEFPDEQVFNAVLAENDLTMETLEEDIVNYLKTTKFLQQQTGELSVTEEEIRQYYDQSVQDMEDAPEFETVRSQIEQGMLEQKRFMAEQEFIQEIREKSDILII